MRNKKSSKRLQKNNLNQNLEYAFKDDTKYINKIISNNNIESAKLIVDILKSEYDNENQRKRELDSKASLFISMNVAILSLIMPNLKYNVLLEWSEKQISNGCTGWLIICIALFLGMVFIILSTLLLIQAASISKYSCIRYEIEDKDFNFDYVDLTKKLCIEYNRILFGNGKEKGYYSKNEKRARKVKVASIFTTIAVVILVIICIVLQLLECTTF